MTKHTQKLRTDQTYMYMWGNNAKRARMKGRLCVVLAQGALNSCMIRFKDNGQREIVSRNALRGVSTAPLRRVQGSCGRRRPFIGL